MKYSLEKEKQKYNNAGSKAVRDVTQIIHDLGYVPFVYESISQFKWLRKLKSLYSIIKLYFILKEEDICFLQWPSRSYLDIFLYYCLSHRCCHLQILIHDLVSIREDKNAEIEMMFLLIAEKLIVHTPAMKNYLSSHGVDENRMMVLYSFDYLISNTKVSDRDMSMNVVFAGNLTKSLFLDKLMGKSLGINLMCYGNSSKDLLPPLVYQGFFDADDVMNIQGSWGLVWDGESVDTCEGLLGKYLKINSPHKVSLYIVSRLPIIIWKESALANYVQDKGLGFVISSLSEIPQMINKISVFEYNQFLLNIDKERYALIKGEHLRRCLKDM